MIASPRAELCRRFQDLLIEALVVGYLMRKRITHGQEFIAYAETFAAVEPALLVIAVLALGRHAEDRVVGDPGWGIRVRGQVQPRPACPTARAPWQACVMSPSAAA